MSAQLPFIYNAMTESERRVWDLLRTRRGREEAISLPLLARAVSIPERELQNIVRDLIIKHHKPIGSTSGKPSGYYLCVSEEDLRRNHEQNKKRGLRLLARAWAFKKDPMIAPIIGQTSMEESSHEGE